MSKKFILATFLLLAACGPKEPTVRYCPNVLINPALNHVTGFYGDDPTYKAEIVGYEGYCRYNGKAEQTVAMVAPIFEISRLSDKAGQKVEIAYYANTNDNEIKMMGRQPHTFSTKIANKGEKMLVTGDEIQVVIPNDTPEYRINLEMALTKRQYQYNKQQGLNF